MARCICTRSVAQLHEAVHLGPAQNPWSELAAEKCKSGIFGLVAAKSSSDTGKLALPEIARQHGWLPGTSYRTSSGNAAYTLLHHIEEAAGRICGSVHVTRVHRSAWLSELGECQAQLKLENEQVTGSFKARGAVNKLLSLSQAEARRGLVTCSTGNHALACLHAHTVLQQQRGADWASELHIYLPETTSPAKADRLASLGANVHFHGQDCVDTETFARSIADAADQLYISPYNDHQIAAGQGTIALELLSQLTPAELQTVYVPVGGGGLISGIASVLKAVQPAIEVVGCQPRASHVMQQCVAAGHIVQAPSLPTLSEGTAGGVEENTITLEPCKNLVDRWVLVSEADIAGAMLGLLEHDNLRVEGAAALTAAALIQDKASRQGQGAVVVCCGGNVSDPAFAAAKDLAHRPKPLR